MAVWRLQLITAGSSIAAYCIQNHVAAMGWSLADIAPTVRQTIKEFEEYCKYADDAYDEKYDSVKRLSSYGTLTVKGIVGNAYGK